MENICENDWRLYVGAQNDPKIGPLEPIFNTSLKIAPIDMHTKTDAKPVEVLCYVTISCRNINTIHPALNDELTT